MSPPALLLAAALAAGQTEVAPTTSPAAQVVEVSPVSPVSPVAESALAPAEKPAPAPPPERWLLLRSFQGTWNGWLLDSRQAQVSGWLQQGFSANPAAHPTASTGFDLCGSPRCFPPTLHTPHSP